MKVTRTETFDLSERRDGSVVVTMYTMLHDNNGISSYGTAVVKDVPAAVRRLSSFFLADTEIAYGNGGVWVRNDRRTMPVLIFVMGE